VGDLHVRIRKTDINVTFGTSRASGLEWIYKTFCEYGLKPIPRFINQSLEPQIEASASRELEEVFKDAKSGVPRWILKAVELGFEDIAWKYVAGFVDAEGSIYVRSPKEGYYVSGLSITSKDENVVNQLIELLGMFGVEAHKVSKGGKAQLYVETEEVGVEKDEGLEGPEEVRAKGERVWFVLRIERREDVKCVLSRILPFMHELFKHDRAEAVLEYIESGRDLKELYDRFLGDDSLSVARRKYSWPKFIDELLHSSELRRELGIGESYARYLALYYAIRVVASLLNNDVLKKLRENGANPPLLYYELCAYRTALEIGDKRLLRAAYEELAKHSKAQEEQMKFNWPELYAKAYEELDRVVSQPELLALRLFESLEPLGRMQIGPVGGGSVVALMSFSDGRELEEAERLLKSLGVERERVKADGGFVLVAWGELVGRYVEAAHLELLACACRSSPRSRDPKQIERLINFAPCTGDARSSSKPLSAKPS